MLLLYQVHKSIIKTEEKKGKSLKAKAEAVILPHSLFAFELIFRACKEALFKKTLIICALSTERK